MPLTIPAFDQYQQQLFPLRGLWNAAPKEGDRFVSAEIDWLVTTAHTAVQFSLSGNSPVAISQIVAMCVDNSRSGADVAMVFPDTGFQLVTPAHNQLIAPVFTNALMFYADSPSAVAGDVTILQVFNSMPPAIPIAPSVSQNSNNAIGISTANGSTAIVPASVVSGTLNTATITFNLQGVTGPGAMQITLMDGTSKVLWTGEINIPATPGTIAPILINNLNVRFQKGINFVVNNSSIASGAMIVSVYYTTP